MSALLEPAAPSAASRHARLDALVERARERARSTMPVVGLVHPGDALALQAAAQMQDAGIARPLLIGPREAIARAAGEAGLDAERAAAILDSDEYGAEVRERERHWQQLGINSVPAVIIDDRHLISGGQPPEVFERALRELAAVA